MVNRMSNPVEKKFNEKQRAYFEQIAWDNKTKEFYVKRTFPKSSDVERHELAEHGLIRKVETCIIIVRQLESEELEQPVKTVFYKLPVTYEIKPEDEDWYLREETVSNPDDRFEKKFKSIMMKNVNNGQCMSIPFPNDTLYHGEYTWLKVTKGKSVRLTKDQLEKLLQTGEAMAIMDMKLENRMVS